MRGVSQNIKTVIYMQYVRTVEVAGLAVHERKLGFASTAQSGEVTTSRFDLRAQGLRVHAVSEIEIGRDLVGLGAGEGASSDSVAPASVSNGRTDEIDFGSKRIRVDLIHEHGDVDASV